MDGRTKVLKERTLAVFEPGCVVEPIGASEGACVSVVVASKAFVEQEVFVEHLACLVEGQRGAAARCAEEERDVIVQMLNLLWTCATNAAVRRSSVADMLRTALNTFDDVICALGISACGATQITDDQASVYWEFCALVRQHFRTQHQVPFYRRKLCVSEKCLRTVVRIAAGTTARSLIARAVVAEAKRLMMQPSMTNTEIAYALGFEREEYFRKFFMGVEGCWPNDWRKEHAAR